MPTSSSSAPTAARTLDTAAIEESGLTVEAPTAVLDRMDTTSHPSPGTEGTAPELVMVIIKVALLPHLLRPRQRRYKEKKIQGLQAYSVEHRLERIPISSR